MMADVLLPLIAVGLAELGDKTQLSILLLSSKTTKHLQLLLGVFFAFLAVDGVAVLVGSWVTDIVPIDVLRLTAGSVFVIFGLLTLRAKEEEGESKFRFKNPFLSGFALIFMMEWGDKTQIASALFAAKYNPIMVLLGSMMALTALSVIAVYLGKIVSSKVDSELITRIAGIVFIIIGISFFVL